MALYRLTRDAQADLVEIRRYSVKQWGLEQSKKYVHELRQTIKILSEMPEMGKQRHEVGNNVFSFPHVSHVIYYIINNKQLIVFGVLHKNMVPLVHLEHRNVI